MAVAKQRETGTEEARGRATPDESQARRAMAARQKLQCYPFLPEKTAGHTSVTSSMKGPVSPAHQCTSITFSAICFANCFLGIDQTMSIQLKNNHVNRYLTPWSCSLVKVRSLLCPRATSALASPVQNCPPQPRVSPNKTRLSWC